ncbi:MAG: NAD(P)H-binding protein [Dehalococcoidia bacterium]|nr:NAD(P)H-binding protein [Dehalococcoidia bacterium]
MPFTQQDIAQGNYLVTGATGRTGRIVVEKLRDAGANVRALVHSTAPEHQLDGVEYVEGDYQDKESLLAATHGIDWVIACVGAQSATRGLHLIEAVEYQGTVNLTEAASENGAKHMSLISVRGADTRWDFYPVYPAKARSDQRLIDARVGGTVFRPGGMIDTSGDIVRRQANTIKTGGTMNIYGTPNQPMVFIFLDELADYLIHSHLERRAYNNIYELGGPGNLTREEYWALFEEYLGIKANVRYLPVDDVVPLRQAAIREQNMPLAHQLSREEIGGRNESGHPPMNIYSRLFDVKQRDFRLWLIGILKSVKAEER